MKNPIVKIIVILTVVFTVLSLSTVIAFRVFISKEKIISAVTPVIERNTGRKISIEDAGISIFPKLGITIQNLTVSNTKRDGFSGEDFIRINNFIVKINLIPLLKKKIIISKILFDEPQILIEKNRDGHYNFDDISYVKTKKPSKEKPEKSIKANKKISTPQILSLKSFEINNGSMKYIDKKTGRVISIGKINHQIKITANMNMTDILSKGLLTLSEISIKSKEFKQLHNFTLSLSHKLRYNTKTDTLSIDSLNLSLQDLAISMSGTVANVSKKPYVDLKLNSGEISISKILSEIPPELYSDINKLSAKGVIKTKFTIKGDVANGGKPKISGGLKIKNGNVKYSDLPEAINNISAFLLFTDNSLNLKELKLKLGQNPVEAKALVRNFKNPYIDANLKANINLSTLKNSVKLSKGNEFAGRVSANILAKGKVNPKKNQNMNIKGYVKLNEVTIKPPALTRSIVLNGSTILTTSKISAQINAMIGESDINLSANIKNFLTMVLKDKTNMPKPKLNFKLSSKLLNTNSFLKSNSTNTTASDSKTDPPASATTTQSAYILATPLPKIDITGTIKSGKVIHKTASLENLTATVKNFSNILTMDVTANLMKGKFRNSITLNHGNISNLRVSTRLNIDGVEIASMISNFRCFIPTEPKFFSSIRNMDRYIDGILFGNAMFKASGATIDDIVNNLDGNLMLRITNGTIKRSNLTGKLSNALSKFYKINDITFREYKSNIRVKEQFVIFDTSYISSSQTGNWGLTGKVGFDNSINLSIKNQLPKNISNNIVSTQKKGKQALNTFLNKNKYTSLLSKEVSSRGIPTDSQGRVNVLFGIEGTLQSPKIESFKFTGNSHSGNNSGGEKRIKYQIKKKALKEKKKLETAANKKLEAERAKLIEKLNKKKVAITKSQTVNKTINATKNKVIKKLPNNNATKKAKNALKKLGI